ncbi:TetR/AcrR family transcriptional regulator [Corynebacterium urealyticum]|uniref:TetR/AcrR family transcriptional regulator n=1 Tax=Corynebacterium urealyticum TaxID=43771 RepID=UPI0002B3F2F9|nr:transcription regulator [Corynebacterium urealyticum DSM 7111]QQB07855.1 TetR family transcriptional regulator [Corynebacterium urealyticum]TYR15680.1 TetR/AcrR family transcriptional regulator [Corynebacterium urealyticum]TYR18015.1 TetR/AcrR family transcriptional regulator [Corynebacterium urealyticum]
MGSARLDGGDSSAGAGAKGRPGYSREEVVEVAIEEFLERGYEATSMGGLATRLGISKSAIYHHVDSKEQLLQEAVDAALNALAGVVAEVGQLDAGVECRLRRLVDGAVAVLAAKQAEVALLLRLRGNSEVEKRALDRRRDITNAVVELVVQGQEEGVVRRDILPGVAARLIFGVVNSMVDWYRPGGGAAYEEVREMVQKFIWTGLGLDVDAGESASDGPFCSFV